MYDNIYIKAIIYVVLKTLYPYITTPMFHDVAL